MTPTTRPRCRAALAALGGVALTACLAFAPLRANVFKCAGENDVPVYQDSPCPAGSELRDFQTDPPAITVLPAARSTLQPRPPATVPAAGERAAKPKPAVAARENKPRGDPRERKFVRTGMTEGDVLAKLGAPEITGRGAKAGGKRWQYLPTALDPHTITTISFANGVVTHVERKVSR